MGASHVLPKTFHPNDFIFTLWAKPITFRPRPPRQISLGGTFLPHFKLSPPLLLLFHLCTVWPSLSSPTLLITLEINMTSVSIDGEYITSDCSSVGSAASAKKKNLTKKNNALTEMDHNEKKCSTSFSPDELLLVAKAFMMVS